MVRAFPLLQFPQLAAARSKLPGPSGDRTVSFGSLGGHGVLSVRLSSRAFSVRAKSSLSRSVDDEATTVGTIEKFKLSFPLGHSADADKVAAITGAYTNETPRYLQATGFLLAPDGKILNAVYSSGPIGRLVAEDVVGMVAYLKSKA